MAGNTRRMAVVHEIKRQDSEALVQLDRVTQQSFKILQFVFIWVPLIAGIDKYFHRLTNWEQFVSPLVMNILGPVGTRIFMQVDGAFEIALGIGVWIRPRIFAYIVSAWLLAIVFNLLTTGHYYDIVLRDLGLSLSAFALGRLSRTQPV